MANGSNGNGLTHDEEENYLKRMLAYNSRWAAQADTAMLARNAKGQQPHVLWLGCADSRIPESILCGSMPGEVFVHRNIANCFTPGDPSSMAVLAYAINNLGIREIVVVGHYGCGGVHAAMGLAKARNQNKAGTNLEVDGAKDEGQATIVQWLQPLRALAVAQLRSTSSNNLNGQPTEADEEEAHRQLVRSHCCAQVSNIESSSVVQKAIKEGHNINVVGWVYDVATGRLVDLDV